MIDALHRGELRGRDELCTPSTHTSIEASRSALSSDICVDVVLTSSVPSNLRKNASGRNQPSIFPRSESTLKTSYPYMNRIPIDISFTCTVLDSTPWTTGTSAFTVNLRESHWKKTQRRCTRRAIPRTTTLSFCSAEPCSPRNIPKRAPESPPYIPEGMPENTSTNL